MHIGLKLDLNSDLNLDSARRRETQALARIGLTPMSALRSDEPQE
jgi:hypothetical protein